MSDTIDRVQLACKEWASVCAAMSASRQHILLRKGGVAESGGNFEIRKGWFLLYPTFVHQQELSLREPGWLDQGEEFRPPVGKVRFFHLVQMVQSWELKVEAKCDVLEPFHVMTPGSVRSRFQYRKPGLHVLLLRCFRLDMPIEVEEASQFLGCKSWVDLENPLSIGGFCPVLNDEEFAGVFFRVRQALEL